MSTKNLNFRNNKDKQSDNSSSLISSSDSSQSQSKYQKKQLQLSKNQKNDTKIIKKYSENQKKYSSRSRSQSFSSSRSRSHHKKDKKKHKKRQNKSRSRQTSSSFRSKSEKNKYRNQKYDRHQRDKKNTQRDKERRDDKRDERRDDRKDDRKDDRRRDERRDDRKFRNDQRCRERDDRKQEQRRERGRSMQKAKEEKIIPVQVPMPLEVPMPPIPGERRRRQRSRSPLDYYKRNQSNNEGEFWDSFSWQPRINYAPNVSSKALINTKKMRRLMITNIPFEMGITKDDLKDLITRFMTKNYLKDTMNNCPVRQLQLNEQDHTAAVELSSVQETCRMCKLQKIELFQGTINGIVRLGDSCYGNNVVTQAQNAAQAQAAAFAAINVLENKKTNFNMEINLNKNVEASTLIRVTNAITGYMAAHLTPQQWKQYYDDLTQGFSLYGKIVHIWFVKADEKNICADPGNLFIEYQAQQQAVKAFNEMQGRMYDERIIRLYYVAREIYYPNYKKDITPPVVKAPAKIQKDINLLPQLSKSSHIATSRNTN